MTRMFERVHALHFVADALEAAHHCLTIVNELVPCQAGLVHFFDVEKRNFLVVGACGDRSADLVLQRHPVEDRLLRGAVSRGRVVTSNGSKSPIEKSAGRLSVLGSVQHVLVAPLMHGHRCLGAIELIDPLDGQPFDVQDENALGYLGDRFAAFISSHGVVVDVHAVACFAFGSRRELPVVR